MRTSRLKMLVNKEQTTRTIPDSQNSWHELNLKSIEDQIGENIFESNELRSKLCTIWLRTDAPFQVLWGVNVTRTL